MGKEPGAAPARAPADWARAGETMAAAAQYVLLGGFTAVAAGISAQGLIGFARDNMALRGPWPYLLFFALDGAAGVCAVVLMHRAARAETALAPRLAVWGLVAASATFNWAHAPPHPAARQAFALMPVIAATLFEFSLHETARRGERATGQPNRRLPALGWLHPAEQLRIRLHLAADPQLPAAEAARRVRVAQAARRLHLLRTALAERPARRGAALRRRWAERRAQAALSRAGFADPHTAADVLRQLQARTLTAALARLDYTTPAAAQTVLASLITAGPPTPPPPRRTTPKTPNGSRALAHPPPPSRPTARPGGRPGRNATPASGAIPGERYDSASGPASVAQASNGASDRESEPGNRAEADGLVAAATQIVTVSRRDGMRLTQAALAAQLRARGYRIANERLHWLSAASGLSPHDPRQPDE